MHSNIVEAPDSSWGESGEEQVDLLPSDPFWLRSSWGFKMVFAKCRHMC